MNYVRLGLWGLALGLAAWWGSTRIMVEKEGKGEGFKGRSGAGVKREREVGAVPRVEEGKKGQAKVDFSGEMETGSGDEMAGEKILRFKNRAAYERFFKMAPAGVVLDQIEQLQAVRVKEGEWLQAMGKSAEMEVGKNYYVAVPAVPAEVKTMGDDFYRVVGREAVKLMGAEGVTSDWGKGVTVALMDTSLNPTSTDLGKEEGHGTAMASLITGVATARGAAPGATLQEYAVLDGTGKGDSFSLAKAIYAAVERGAKVINMSLGSSGDCGVVREAVAYALAKNVALVAAAGNEAINQVAYPAAYEGVVAVGAVDGDPVNPQHLYFSNRGAAVDIVAPGFAVVANWPGGKMVEVSGTSASTALVSGAIAAVLSKERSLTGKQAAELVIRYANDTGVAGVDDETGRGLVNLQRVFERNQRGLIDLAIAGVKLDPAGKVTVTVQNRGTETVNSPTIEMTVNGATRKFYPGSLAPNQSMAESVQFDPARAKLEGRVYVGANVEAPRGSDQRPGNDMWTGGFIMGK